MQVTIKYHDNDSLTVEEVVRQAMHNYGKSIIVDILPDSCKPHDLITFGIQQIITHKQLSLLYDRSANYQKDISDLRAEVLAELKEILDQVIIENEAKVE